MRYRGSTIGRELGTTGAPLYHGTSTYTYYYSKYERVLEYITKGEFLDSLAPAGLARSAEGRLHHAGSVASVRRGGE